MKKYKKLIVIFILLLITIGSVWVYQVYKNIYTANVSISKEYQYLYIPSGSTFSDLIMIIEKEQCLKDIESFKQVAELKSFSKIKPGKYKIYNNMSNNALVNMLRIGDQVPVHITFNHIRTLQQLAGKMSKNIEIDSISLGIYLSSTQVQAKYGFNKHTFISMFIANTYEVYWDITKEAFVKRMAVEYKKFWNTSRKHKAQQLHLSQSEITTLASIVELESLKKDEKPVIAGVYINRLKKRMLLQADPTVIFAVGDFSIKRVLKKHLSIDSPYNTYKYTGLPPGPIYLPSPQTIDAVLNYKAHRYIYFCAKEDFSGYHNFAKTYREHINNARRYQRALSRKRIYK